MKEKLKFIELMCEDLIENVKTHIESNNQYEKDWNLYRKGQISYPVDANYLNKNHGKIAIKRKITYLRQELLNLQRMIDKSGEEE